MTGGEVGALVAMLAVGSSLGAIGGGGSVLALPILVFIGQLPVAEAITMALAVTAATSLLGGLLHLRAGGVDVRAAVLFVIPGALASVGAAQATSLVSDRVLLAIFAAVAVVAGSATLVGKPAGGSGRGSRILPSVLAGAVTGGLAGFLGVGGGFLIVPALVLFAGVPTKAAIGTSLWIITLNATAGFVGHLGSVRLDVLFTLGLVGASVLGLLAGFRLSKWASGPGLKKALGWVVIAVGAGVGIMSALGVTLSGG